MYCCSIYKSKQGDQYPCDARQCRTSWLVVRSPSDNYNRHRVSYLVDVFVRGKRSRYIQGSTADLDDGVRCDSRPKKQAGNHCRLANVLPSASHPGGIALLGWAVFPAHIDHFQLTTGHRRLVPSAKSQDLSNLSDEHFLDVVESTTRRNEGIF